MRYYTLLCATGWVERIYWWQLVAPGYGLIDSRSPSWRKRPSFFAFQTMAKHLRDCRFLRRIPHSQAEVFLFGREEERILVVWTQEKESGSVLWYTDNGGVLGYPSAARSGSYNAILANDDWSGPKTKLVLALDFGSHSSNGRLTFWHCMAPWAGDQDELRVYYKTSSEGSWIPLATYTSAVTSWT